MNQHSPVDALNNSPMSRLQVMAVGMCVLLNALDGFDVLSIAFAAPGIAAEWGIDRAALGVVLSMELIGMGIGSITLGRWADLHGRRFATLLCLVIMSGGMLLAGFANSVNEMLLYRFITGLGIGGLLATTNALAAEYSNAKNRSLSIMLMVGGFPLGIIAGGVVASFLLDIYSWRAVFYFGFAASAFFLLVVFLWLPESPVFLSQKQPKNALERLNKLLLLMRHSPIDRLPDVTTDLQSTKVSIFGKSLRRSTIALTVANFAHIMVFYYFIKWIPKLVVDIGYPASEAAQVLVWANVGSLTVCVLLGFVSQKVKVKVLALASLVFSAFAINLFGSGQQDLLALSVVAAIGGFCTNGAIVCLYTLFAQVYPAQVRASGTGFVIGVGRGGAALGPILGGLLFAEGLELQMVSLLMSLSCILAATSLLFLRQ